jgi:tRNA threonylcarbamoyladenosine biosynthesis protein TsaB
LRPDPLILAFDTSAAHCVAGLLLGDRVLAVRSEFLAVGQADILVPTLESVLAEGKVGWADLSAIGVGIGPGNFTGIRISVSAARGFALALDIPAIGVSVLEALAFGTQGDVLVSLDGRLGRIYAQSFRNGAAVTEAALCDFDDLPTASSKCLGFEADKVAGLTGGVAGSERTIPDPIAIARIAAARLGTQQPSPAPFYLRPADAAPSTQPVLTITP